MNGKSCGQKRKRKYPERFGEKGILDDLNDEWESEIDSISNDGDFTPTKKSRYGQKVIHSDDDDDDISESTGRSANFGEKQNFDADMDWIDVAEASNHNTSNSISITGRKNRHESGQIDHILQSVLKSLATVSSSIENMNEKIDQGFARVSVIESKLIDRLAKNSCDSTFVKSSDESREQKMYFKANCLPFTNIDDMNRFEKNLEDADFRNQTVSINIYDYD